MIGWIRQPQVDADRVIVYRTPKAARKGHGDCSLKQVAFKFTGVTNLGQTEKGARDD
jgi:hypothetical protein